jgi:hypothetical protein
VRSLPRKRRRFEPRDFLDCRSQVANRADAPHGLRYARRGRGVGPSRCRLHGLALFLFARAVRRICTPATHVRAIVLSASDYFRVESLVAMNLPIHRFLRSLVRHGCLPGRARVILFSLATLFSDGYFTSLVWALNISLRVSVHKSSDRTHRSSFHVATQKALLRWVARASAMMRDAFPQVPRPRYYRDTCLLCYRPNLASRAGEATIWGGPTHGQHTPAARVSVEAFAK